MALLDCLTTRKTMPRRSPSAESLRANAAGFTLVEVIFGVLLIVGGGGALLLAMSSATMHSEYLGQAQIAVNAAQGRLEELAATDFDVLWTSNSVTLGDRTVVNLVNARADRALLAVTTPLLPNGQPVLSNGQLAVQIRPVPITTPPATPTLALLDIHVAACWTYKTRAIGERGATSCQDGAADGAANWSVDSPVMVSRRVGLTAP